MEEWMEDGRRRERRWSLAASIGGAVLVLVIVGVGLYVTFNRVEAGDERTLATLRASNLHDLKLGGAATAGCEEAESSRQFTATNATGEHVKGTVCCGLTGAVKGCMIRWDH